jgi:hypothetical protein
MLKELYEEGEMFFVYLFPLSVCRNFNVIGLRSSGEFCSGGQVMRKGTEYLLFTPPLPPPHPRN